MDSTSGPTVGSEQSHPNAQLRTQKRVLLEMPRGWKRNKRHQNEAVESSASSVDEEKDILPTEKWSLGILNDKRTDEVPGTWTAAVPDIGL
jgi:hypothetical protein